MIDLGDQITLTYPSKPASPAAVTVTITLPDGTNTGPISALSGSYTYTTTQPGRHIVLWQSTGPSDAYADAFDVAETDPGAVISLQDAKNQLNTPDSDDEDLRLYLAAVTSVIESITGPIITNEHIDILPASDRIVLRKAPVQSVTSIVPTDPGFAGAFVGNYILEPATGILRRQGFYPFEPAYAFQIEHTYWFEGYDLTITYTAGRAEVPAGVQVAARMILEQSWASRRGAMPLPPMGGDTVIQENGLDILISETAMGMLAPFAVRGPRIA